MMISQQELVTYCVGKGTVGTLLLPYLKVFQQISHFTNAAGLKLETDHWFLEKGNVTNE